MKKKLFLIACLLILAMLLSGCGKAPEAQGGYRGISVASPDWVGKLDAAKRRSRC
jgi:hypothetical protein